MIATVHYADSAAAVVSIGFAVVVGELRRVCRARRCTGCGARLGRRPSDACDGIYGSVSTSCDFLARSERRARRA
jgi:hypothetical protein